MISIGSKVKIKLGSRIVIGRVVSFDDSNIFPYLVEGPFTTQRVSETQIITVM